MKRCHPSSLGRWCAATLLAASVVGCASLTQTNESIVQVQSRHEPAKAARLTLHGIKAMKTGDVDRAVAKFLAAIDADETYGPAHNNLGLLHYDQGNLYQAVLAFEQASDLMPHDPTVYYNLGLTLESAGKVYEALDLYWQAVEMDPVNPNYLGNLVRLRIRLGEDGPEVQSQLEDLALIETRPDWRRWADRQLALEMNDALDRGPETPDFDAELGGADESDEPSVSRVIDLTPKNPEPRDRDKRRIEPLPVPANPLMSEPRIVPSPKLNAPQVRSKPIPMRDRGSLENLPPSIDLSPDPQVDNYFQ